jgi:hypothetical protein
VRKPDPRSSARPLVAGARPKSVIQEVTSKLAEVINIPKDSPHQITFLEQLSMSLFYVDDSWRRKLVKKDIAFETAQKKIREAKIAFDKLSDQQRKMIHLTIQDTQVIAVTVQDTQVTASDTVWPRPETLISGIVNAFAILTGKNPRPLAHGKGITSHYPFRVFVLSLRKLVESCDGRFYPDPKALHGGRKFKAVVDILREYYPGFVPEAFSLKTIMRIGEGTRKAITPQSKDKCLGGIPPNQKINV